MAENTHKEKDWLDPNKINYTDLVVPEIDLYIEGIQVPFMNMSISQSSGSMPSAVVELPPAPGLMDIAKYYAPKVHIFFEDPVYGGRRLLFTGVLTDPSYTSTTRSSSIQFNCVHKNYVLSQVALDYSGWGNEINVDPQRDALWKPGAFSASHSLINALRGLSGIQDKVNPYSLENRDKIKDVDTSKLDASIAIFEKRLTGMPSAVVNMWNQLKKECYFYPEFNSIITTVYIPLVEQGLNWFSRMSGHHVLEKLVDAGKQDTCKTTENKDEVPDKIMIPPSFKLLTMSSAQSALAVEMIRNQLSFTGENTDFFSIFSNFYLSMEYEILTLASPASVPVDPTTNVEVNENTELCAVETVVKPQVPFYYAPICNVLLPKMHSGVQVGQSDFSLPTRLTVRHQLPGAPAEGSLCYRAPHSIRECISQGFAMNKPNDTLNLLSTVASSYNIPTKSELGRGFIPKTIMMPDWLVFLTKDAEVSSRTGKETWPEKGSVEATLIKDLNSAWEDRYAYKKIDGVNVLDQTKTTLNPYSENSGISPYQRMLFSTADYEFSKMMNSSRSGSVNCIFNPYIVPGYPMEIVAKDANNPSFHAMCTSVTHSISPSSISTSVSFVAATTYTELSNYHMQHVHPWLQSVLKMVNVKRKAAAGEKPDSTKKDEIYGLPPDPAYDGTYTGDVEKVEGTLFNNPRAKAIADVFYMSVLGVGAADPSLLVDINSGDIQAISRDGITFAPGFKESARTYNGGEFNDNLTSMGNLRLVARRIESKQNLMDKFGIKFVDMTEENYTPTAYKYQNNQLVNSTLLEQGMSLFLEYPEIDEWLKSNGYTDLTKKTN